MKTVTYEVRLKWIGFSPKTFKTLKEARDYQQNGINTVGKNSEHWEYWENERLNSKIFKVVRIEEEEEII